MTRVYGKTKGFIWWLSGMVCSVLFGSNAAAQGAQVKYGVRPRPPPDDSDRIQPAYGVRPVPLPPEGQADLLVAQWLGAAPADRERLAAALANMGATGREAIARQKRAATASADKARKDVEEAQKIGDEAAADRASDAGRDAQKRLRELTALETRVAQPAPPVVKPDPGNRPGPQPKYGVQVRYGIRRPPS